MSKDTKANLISFVDMITKKQYALRAIVHLSANQVESSRTCKTFETLLQLLKGTLMLIGNGATYNTNGFVIKIEGIVANISIYIRSYRSDWIFFLISSRCLKLHSSCKSTKIDCSVLVILMSSICFVWPMYYTIRKKPLCAKIFNVRVNCLLILFTPVVIDNNVFLVLVTSVNFKEPRKQSLRLENI